MEFSTLILISTTILILSPVAAGSTAFNCPVECVCSPNAEEPSNEDDWSSRPGQLLDVTCVWPHIPGANLFSTFPHSQVYRLAIQCKDTFPRSRYVSSMFSSFTSLRHLTITNCHSEDSGLPSGLLQGLTRLKTLHLDSVSMPGLKLHLDIGALVGSPALERLTLIQSNLAEVPGNVMCHFKELKLLNLSNNDIRDLKAIGYGGNGDCENNLVILDLSNNRVTQIDDNALRKMYYLHILRLGENSISSISTGAFTQLPRLQELFLNGNNLTKLEELPSSVQILDLSENHIRILPSNMRNYNNLLQLNLSGNLLFDDDSSSSILRLSPQLTVLDLSHNKLQHISGNTFENATYLQQLYLRQNRIEKLENNLFSSMPRLRYLDLSSNQIQRLNKEHINGLQNLTELILDNNAIATIADDAFGATPQLRQLSLASNAITQTPTALTLLYFLQRLDVSKNRITMIPKFLFDKTPNLKELRLASNQIRSVERYVFEKLPSLTALDLSDNQIEQLATNCFEGTAAIKTLRLDANAISDIQGNFVGLPQLQSLNLSSNRIAYIDFAMLPIGLKTLHASNNAITHVSNVLLQHQRRPPQLTALDLSRNKIKQLNGEMLPNSIETANFSGNNIASIEDGTTMDKLNLSNLDLTYNRLDEIRPEAVKSKSTTTPYKLSLIGNPLRCTCHNEWIHGISKLSDNHGLNKPRMYEVSSIPPTLINSQELKCIPPLSVQQEPLFFKDVRADEFLCEYDVSCADECMCCEFDSCDCKSVCPDGCKCFHNNKHRLNVIRCDKDFQTSPLNLRRKIPMHATKIDLSRTEIEELQSNSFFARFKLRLLYLNNTNIRTIAINAFNGLTSLETLDLSFNLLEDIAGHEFNNLPKLHRLQLNDNRLQSIPEALFERLNALRELALHNNRFTTLPNAVVNFSPTLATMTLSGNPWKCDCDANRYILQRWLPENTILVRDYRTIYCADSIVSEGRTNPSSTNLTNATSALSILPVVAVGQTVIKVNFWTFVNGINITFCRPISAINDVTTAVTNDPTNSDHDYVTPKSVPDTSLDTRIMLICVAVAAVILILVIIFIAWRFQDFLRCRYTKYSTTGAASSVNSSTRTTATTPVPLLQYDAFVNYSMDEQEFVTDQITNRLEQEYPYYNLCLLYRDLPNSPCTDCHRVDDKIITNMERSKRLIIILTNKFLEQEWKSIQLRTAFQYLIREKLRKPIIVVVIDELPDDIDPTLGHYIRMNRCLYWGDPMFWQKFVEAMPERSIQQEETLTYSECGTIVPSRFV